MADAEKIQTRVPSVLEDPSSQAVARVYANAFLGAAGDTGVDNALEEFDSFVDDVLEKNPAFQEVLTSGIVGRDDKLGLIHRTLSGKGSEFFVNFLQVLCRHDRLELLPLIRNESRLQHEKNLGQKRVLVKTARKLSDESRKTITQRLEQEFGFKPILTEQLDETLLGGLVIQVGDTVYDSSLKTRMKQLRESLRERALNEIQSGRDRFSNPKGN